MRRGVHVAAAVAAALSLAGCVVGPSYRPPTAPAGAAGPLAAVNPAAEATSAAPDDWWRLYADPRLDGYVREASRAQQYPSTTTVAGGIYGRDAQTNEILEITGHKPETIWKYDVVLDASYELDVFGRVRRSIQAAHADADAVAAARDDLKVTIAAETARAYAQICTLGEQIAVARRALEIVAHEADISTNRRQAGAGSEFEEVRAEALVAQVRSSIPPLEGQRRAALFQLTALLGRTPANAPIEAQACVTAPALTGRIPVGDGASLLKRRPDVRRADRRLAGEIARVGVATADLYPRITLTGLYGGVGTELPALTENRGLIWGVGPSISWAFPNQAAPRARLRQAKAQESAALAGFDSVVLQALKETSTSLATYSAELDHYRALADAQTKSARAYELAHGQYLAGASTQLDLLATEQSLVSADAAVAASHAALAQDQIAIFKALGGGWATQAGP